MNNKTQLFIEKALIKHAGAYSYEKSVYVNSKTKLVITCPEHGDFEQTPHIHLRGSLCPKCARTHLKETTEGFIKRAEAVHKNTYSYENAHYTNNKTKITITCSVHGDFQQQPSSHLKGSGCIHCANYALSFTQDTFIEKAKALHGEKYDYSRIKYKNIKSKIRIRCIKHGIFQKSPEKHLLGHGCPECRAASEYQNLKSGFIKKAQKIHGDKYSYEKSDYLDSRAKTVITCPKHGDFEQLMRSHLRGHGCPVCSTSHGEHAIALFLKNMNVAFEAQKTFPDCLGNNKRPLRFDFFVPEMNLLIEYDGEQHFRPVDIFGGMKEFLKRKKYDITKNNYCKVNHIPLIRIAFNENVEDKLNAVFSSKLAA